MRLHVVDYQYAAPLNDFRYTGIFPRQCRREFICIRCEGDSFKIFKVSYMSLCCTEYTFYLDPNVFNLLFEWDNVNIISNS